PPCSTKRSARRCSSGPRRWPPAGTSPGTVRVGGIRGHWSEHSPRRDLPVDVTVQLVEAGDLDGLLRRIDELCEAGDWDELARLGQLARRGSATERARQLVVAAANADYRLALEGPPAHAARAVAEGGDGFALGPLTEVAAFTHTWAELSPHLPPGPVRALVAYERVVRGEDLRADRSI